MGWKSKLKKIMILFFLIVCFVELRCQGIVNETWQDLLLIFLHFFGFVDS